MTKRRTNGYKLPKIVTAFMMMGTAVMPAMAAETCVTCSGPTATYRCALDGSDASRTADPALQVLCITELAKRGGHSSCSIDRTTANPPCNGELVTLARPPAGSPVPAVVETAPANPPADTAAVPAPAAPPSKGPPATVEALAKEAAEQTKKDWEKTKTSVKETTDAAGHEIKKAGNTVGSALKKSWECLSSLFSQC